MSVGKIATLVEVRPPHQLSDGAMRNLHGLKQLRVLDLRDSECSEAALNELRRELPECQLLRAD